MLTFSQLRVLSYLSCFSCFNEFMVLVVHHVAQCNNHWGCPPPQVFKGKPHIQTYPPHAKTIIWSSKLHTKLFNDVHILFLMELMLGNGLWLDLAQGHLLLSWVHLMAIIYCSSLPISSVFFASIILKSRSRISTQDRGSSVGN